MAARPAGARDPGAADRLGDDRDLAQTTPPRQLAQAVNIRDYLADQPLERHWPLATDKIALFEVPQAYLLIGHVQGPGRLGELLRRARP
jgi:hypothetical protein